MKKARQILLKRYDKESDIDNPCNYRVIERKSICEEPFFLWDCSYLIVEMKNHENRDLVFQSVQDSLEKGTEFEKISNAIYRYNCLHVLRCVIDFLHTGKIQTVNKADTIRVIEIRSKLNGLGCFEHMIYPGQIPYSHIHKDDDLKTSAYLQLGKQAEREWKREATEKLIRKFSE